MPDVSINYAVSAVDSLGGESLRLQLQYHMMRKLFVLLIVFLSFSAVATARPLLTEVKIGGFHPWSDVLRDIYGDTWGNYQLELNYRLWRGFYGWGSIQYTEKHGRSLSDHQPTKITLVPGTLGLKFFASSFRYLPRWCETVDVYIGGGARYFSLRVHNDSDFVSRWVIRSGWGGAGTVGVLMRLSKRFAFDAFSDFSIKRMDFSQSSAVVLRHNIDVGGMTLGIGFGGYF